MVILLIVCFGRDWSGDLKKLPNIKLRKVSKKGLEMKIAGEEKPEADKEEEEDDDDADANLGHHLEDEQEDEAMSDSN